MNYRVTAVGGLNARSGPGTSYEVETTLVPDQIVESPDTAGWIPIVLEDEDGAESIGWCSAKYLIQTDGEEPTPIPTPTPIPGKEPAWIIWARKQIGQKEVPGSGDNPTIAAWYHLTTLPEDLWHDSTAWCAVFVNAALMLNGVKTIRSARAFDWAEWGQDVSTPKLGDVVIFSFSHVAFYLSGYGTGTIKALGGNQGDAVTIANFDEDSVQEYRRAPA